MCIMTAILKHNIDTHEQCCNYCALEVQVPTVLVWTRGRWSLLVLCALTVCYRRRELGCQNLLGPVLHFLPCTSVVGNVLQTT